MSRTSPLPHSGHCPPSCSAPCWATGSQSGLQSCRAHASTPHTACHIHGPVRQLLPLFTLTHRGASAILLRAAGKPHPSEAFSCLSHTGTRVAEHSEGRPTRQVGCRTLLMTADFSEASVPRDSPMSPVDMLSVQLLTHFKHFPLPSSLGLLCPPSPRQPASEVVFLLPLLSL